jgi:hypothetical protein
VLSRRTTTSTHTKESTMNGQTRNAWKRHTGLDSLFNGGLIGLVIAGLLLAVLDGPAPASLPGMEQRGNGPVAILGVRA